MAGKNFYRLKACFYFAIFLLTTPFYVLVTGLLWSAFKILRVLNIYKKKTTVLLPAKLRRTVLVTDSVNAKTLHVIRVLGKVGHRIILVDSNRYKHSAGSWSKYVSKVVYVSHHAGKTEQNYINEVVQVALDENVDWFVPISKTQNALVNYEVEKKLSEVRPNIRCFGLGDLELARKLDDKEEFYLMCQKIGMSIPDYRVINGIEELKKLREEGLFDEKHFFLKPTYSFSEDRLNFKKIPSKLEDFNVYLKEFEHKLARGNYVASEFVKGQEFSSNAICSNGKVLSFETSPTSGFQTEFDYVPNQALKIWTMEFCKKMNIIGAISFDFIQDDVTGSVYCIECNPRLHSILVLHHGNPELAKVIQAVLEPEIDHDEELSYPLEPHSTAPRAYWMSQEFHKLFVMRRGLGEFFWSLWNGREAMYDVDDPLPFLATYTSNVLIQLSRAIISGTHFEVYNPVIGRLIHCFTKKIDEN